MQWRVGGLSAWHRHDLRDVRFPRFGADDRPRDASKKSCLRWARPSGRFLEIGCRESGEPALNAG